MFLIVPPWSLSTASLTFARGVGNLKPTAQTPECATNQKREALQSPGSLCHCSLRSSRKKGVKVIHTLKKRSRPIDRAECESQAGAECGYVLEAKSQKPSAVVERCGFLLCTESGPSLEPGLLQRFSSKLLFFSGSQTPES